MTDHPLIAYRKERGISPSVFAAAAGITRQHLWRIETKMNVPSVALIRRLASATDQIVTGAMILETCLRADPPETTQ